MRLHAFVAASALASVAAAATNTSVAGVTCGNTEYSSKQVQEALSEGCRLYEADETVGSNRYPHTFNNREDLSFSVDGPYQEFPIIKSGKFGKRAIPKTGGNKKPKNNNPGPDRVVFNPNLNGECAYVGAMTHTGAEGNSFVMCESEDEDEDEDSAGMAASPAWLTLGFAAFWAFGL